MSAPAHFNTPSHGLASLHGKKFDVMLIESDAAGNEKSVLLTGTGRWHDGRFSIYRGANLPELPIPEENLTGLIPVPRSLRSLLEGADYTIKLQVRHPAALDNMRTQPGAFSRAQALA
jgi:hypothetical protein